MQISVIHVAIQILDTVMLPIQAKISNCTIWITAPNILDKLAYLVNPIGDNTGKPNTIDGNEHHSAGNNSLK